MVIQHNMPAINAIERSRIISCNFSKSVEKLSSGYCINRGADDAAGLTISEKMRYQIRGLDRSIYNIQDGISLIQVADGALEEVHGMLNRMNELSVQAANDTNTFDDRQALQSEINQLAKEIDRIGSTTTFNGLYLFDELRPGSGEVIKSMTELVKCNAAETGGLTDAYQMPSGKWAPAAKMDFSKLNEKSIKLLDGKSFSFTCSQACEEVFEFTFSSSTSSLSNRNNNYIHNYTINIGGMTDGKQVVNEILSYIYGNPLTASDKPPGRGGETYINDLSGGLYTLQVSHSNYLMNDPSDPNSLYIVAKSPTYSTEAEAKNWYNTSKKNTKYAGVDCSQITGVIDDSNDPINKIKIQASFRPYEEIELQIERMNSKILGVNALKVDSFQSAGKSMEKIQAALDEVSTRRSKLGAYQN